MHAYQSYVWNAIVSERIRLYGAEKPVVGDLVFEADDADGKARAADDDDAEDAEDELAAEEKGDEKQDGALPLRARRVGLLMNVCASQRKVVKVGKRASGPASPGNRRGSRR